jgi:NAD(P)H-nitrite reductase large subunit
MNDWRDDEAILCHCRNVKAGVVRSAVRDQGLKTTDAIARFCRAGTGCRSCLPDIEEVVRQEKAPKVGVLRRIFGIFGAKR